MGHCDKQSQQSKKRAAYPISFASLIAVLCEAQPRVEDIFVNPNWRRIEEDIPPGQSYCEIGNFIHPDAQITAQVLNPIPGTFTVRENVPIPLIAAATDADLFVQLCRCAIDEEESCITNATVPVSDPIGYSWNLTGSGTLTGPGFGPSNLYIPPSLNIGQTSNAEIQIPIRDGRLNDPPTRIRIIITIERVDPSSYKRTIVVLIEGDRAPPLDLLAGDCTCQPTGPVNWQTEPTVIDGAISGPAVVDAGKRYILAVNGKDQDVLPLECSGSCGTIGVSYLLPDELRHLWTADRGTFPDHGGGAAQTTAWESTVIYKAPDTPGADRIFDEIDDTATQADDPSVTKRHDLLVLKIDLDIDSNNTKKAYEDPQDDPERTEGEDQIEDDDCAPGKVLAVNNGDFDRDDVPDYADGFDIFSNGSAGASASFTPVILELLDPIDLDKALVRFIYSASDPTLVTRTQRPDGAFDYQVAQGSLRIWGQDGEVPRNKNSLDLGGDYVSPTVEYSPTRHFPAPIASRTWRFFTEGIRESGNIGGERILVEADPDGPGPLGYILSDAVRLTVVKNNLVLTETNGTRLPGFITESRPIIELERIDPGSINIETGGIVQVSLKGNVLDKIADIIPQGLADIPYVFTEGNQLPVLRDPDQPVSRARPYAYKGTFEGTVSVELAPGETEFVLRTAPNVLGLEGEAKISLTSELATATALAITSVSSSAPALGTTTVSSTTTTTPSATPKSGCFRSYYGRMHDSRGLRDDLHIEDKISPLEPDPTFAQSFLSKEPFIFIARPASINHDHLIVLDPGDPARWRYTTTGNLWPVVHVNLDADINEDDQIDEEDEKLEDVDPGLMLPPNLDDDNQDGAPDNRNDSVDGNDDTDDLKEIIIRSLPGVPPEAPIKATLHKQGQGQLRLFLDTGGSYREILAPDDSETQNFWSELSQGDLTLLAEGVRKGDVILELRIEWVENLCSDFLTIRVPGFELEIGLEEPLLDQDDPPFSASGFLEIPADFVSVDFDSVLKEGAANFFAHYYREDELDSEEVPRSDDPVGD